MSQRIDQITIVGGGTAGWLTALLLQSFLNRRPDQRPVTITLIESPNIPTIGVGEATVRGITNLFRQIGISERAFMRRCNATFKLAAEFVGWSNDENGQPLYFLHPFNFPRPLDGINPGYHFLKYGSINGTKAAEALTWNQAIISARKGPRPLGGKDYEAVVSYAYHLDASLFGAFLRETAVERGVIRIEDDVLDVELDEKGNVANLKLERNGTHPIKLVIDCTGFRSIIMQGAMKEEFISYSDCLLNDRALPLQIPIPTDRPLPSATRATALTAGWVFRVPLAERVGTGYIFSSQFKTDEEAYTEFVQHLRDTGDLTPDMPDPEPRFIRMKTGHTRRSWVGNCVAIGLANGFVEPLEATAIYMIESAGRWLVNYFPDEGLNPAFAEAFNRRMEGLYSEIRDFLCMHYYSSNRPEPFWQEARAPGRPPERLMEQLRLWKHTLPSDQDMFYKGLFGEWNYLYCLWEKGYWKSDSYPLTPLAFEESWRDFEQQINTVTRDLLQKLPDHRELLSEIRGERQATEAAFQPFAGNMIGVGGDGSWQAAQPVYQAGPSLGATPPKSASNEPAQPMPAPSAPPAPQPAPAAYQPQAPYQPQVSYPTASGAPASGGVTYGAASFGSPSYQPTPPAAPSSPPETTLPETTIPETTQGVTFTPAPPTPQAAPPAGPSFAAPLFGSEAPPPDMPGTAAPPAEPGGFSAGLTFGAPMPSTPQQGTPQQGTPQQAAPKQEAPAPEAKPKPSPFEESLAKRYGKRPTINTPR